MADVIVADLRTSNYLLFFMNAIDKSISSLFATAWEDGNRYKSEARSYWEGIKTGQLHQVHAT
jgi:hypothetical protein